MLTPNTDYIVGNGWKKNFNSSISLMKRPRELNFISFRLKSNKDIGLIPLPDKMSA
jgi:hypothetical protein